MASITIEPTSRCTVMCPRCPRTQLINDFGKKFLPIDDVNVNDLKIFLDQPVRKIRYCGTYGDPIMHPAFTDLIETSRAVSDTIIIDTSGSGRNSAWWHDTVANLTSNDTVNFAIDGLPENFTTYRINANWRQIEQAIKICVDANVKTQWTYIPFSFNEHCIEQAQALSDELGIDEFLVVPSDRWLENDPLQPKNFKGPREDAHKATSVEIDPKCANHSGMYITASGFFLPCCFVHDFRYYYKSNWWRDRKKYDISKTTFSECIRHFDDFYSTIHDSRPDYCVFNCGRC